MTQSGSSAASEAKGPKLVIESAIPLSHTLSYMCSWSNAQFSHVPNFAKECKRFEKMKESLSKEPFLQTRNLWNFVEPSGVITPRRERDTLSCSKMPPKDSSMTAALVSYR